MLREEQDIFDLNPIRKRSIKISDLEVYQSYSFKELELS